MWRFALLTLLLVAVTNAAPHTTTVVPEGAVVPENAHVAPPRLLSKIGKITKAANALTHSTHGSTAQVHEQSKQIGALKKQLAHMEESFDQTAPDG